MAGFQTLQSSMGQSVVKTKNEERRERERERESEKWIMPHAFTRRCE
jgi:hypothetical protein